MDWPTGGIPGTGKRAARGPPVGCRGAPPPPSGKHRLTGAPRLGSQGHGSGGGVTSTATRGTRVRVRGRGQGGVTRRSSGGSHLALKWMAPSLWSALRMGGGKRGGGGGGPPAACTRAPNLWRGFEVGNMEFDARDRQRYRYRCPASSGKMLSSHRMLQARPSPCLWAFPHDIRPEYQTRISDPLF